MAETANADCFRWRSGSLTCGTRIRIPVRLARNGHPRSDLRLSASSDRRLAGPECFPTCRRRRLMQSRASRPPARSGAGNAGGRSGRLRGPHHGRNRGRHPWPVTVEACRQSEAGALTKALCSRARLSAGPVWPRSGMLQSHRDPTVDPGASSTLSQDRSGVTSGILLRCPAASWWPPALPSEAGASRSGDLPADSRKANPGIRDHAESAGH